MRRAHSKKGNSLAFESCIRAAHEIVMISTALRNFKEPTKDELSHIYFAIPPSTLNNVIEKMDINAVLTLGDAEEESYVSHQRCLMTALLTV